MVSRVRRSLQPRESNEDLGMVFQFCKEKNLIYRVRKVGPSDRTQEVAAVLFTKQNAQAAFQRFNDVLLIDSTYGTNQEKYPLVNFVGVDNHGLSFLAASAIVMDESSQSFMDLLREFLSIMGRPEIPVVVADGDEALRKAVSTLLPKSVQLLCRWHLGLNLRKSLLAKKVSLRIREDAIRDFYVLAWKEDEKAYNDAFKSFICKYEEAAEYMNRIKMLERRWTGPYTKYFPKLNCDTTQRVESMHSRIKLVLPNKLCFLELVRAVSEAMDEQAAKRHIADAMSIQRNLVQLCPELSSLSGLIPIDHLKEINNLYRSASQMNLVVREEPDGTCVVAGERLSMHGGCSCVRWKSELKLCIHFLSAARHKNHSIVPSMVHSRWHLAQNLSIFASPVLYTIADEDVEPPADEYSLVQDGDTSLNGDEEVGLAGNADVSRELAVLNSFIGDIQSAVEEGPDDLKQFIFSEVIPLYYSKFINQNTQPEVPLVLRAKTSFKGRPKKATKQPRLRPLVEVDEDSQKKKLSKKKHL